VLLKRAGVDDLFEEATTASDVDQSKPAPDPVRAALGKLDLPADSVVMVGDTPYDVDSAARAGIGVVAVRSGGWDDGSLEGALAIYDSPADILANVNRSPLAGHGGSR
jgi:phosphoglycolate phosphatase-like HAD superfamily hydrolase